MDAEKSVEHVQRLLALLPGVRLTWTQMPPNFIRLGLAITDARSLAMLAHIVVAANVSLGVEVDWHCPDGGHDDPDCVRYDLRVPLESGPFDPPSNLQLVGGMLARKLRDRGLLAPSEANHLLQAWSFALE